MTCERITEERIVRDAIEKAAGFTLLELVVVIAIVAIMAAVSFPAITKWLPNYKLKGAAMDLYSRMQFAKSEAIRANSQYAVIFDPGNEEYKLVSSPGADGIFGTGGDDNEVEIIKVSDYKFGIVYGKGSATKNMDDGGGSFPADAVSFSSNMVVFSGNGLCDNSGSVYLQNDANRAYAVGALASGVVRIKVWRGSDWQ
jgi:type IV fimbrial biogenesis protein FimT